MPKDELGLRIKPGHDGVAAGPFGDYVYLIVRNDDKMVDVEPTRHDAVARRTKLHDCDDYEIMGVPVGQVRMTDLAINWENQ